MLGKNNRNMKESDTDSCTSQECSWLPPAHNVSYRLWLLVDTTVECMLCSSFAVGYPCSCSWYKFCTTSQPQEGCRRGCGQGLTKSIHPASTTELDNFYKAINEAKRMPVILKITHPFANTFIPLHSQSVFPLPITELYNPATLAMEYPDLLKECEVFNTIKVITHNCISCDSKFVINFLCSNDLGDAWPGSNIGDRNQRTILKVLVSARITASNFKSVVTNPCMPSQSLTKRICYPETFKFTTAAIKWVYAFMSSHVGIITAPYVSCVVCLSVFTDGDAYMRRMAFSYTLVVQPWLMMDFRSKRRDFLWTWKDHI